MHFFAASILIQILCAVHCVRHSRNGLWLTVIIFLSVPGCAAYLIFEVLPQISGRRDVRLAKAVAMRKLDPDRDVRTAREALDLADTAANRILLGDALAEKGDWKDSIAHYRDALAKAPGPDRTVRFKLARALLESGNAKAALAELETLPESGSPSENDRAALMLARAAEECGEIERALTLYRDVGRRLPGGEAQCRHAALLMNQGRRSEALALLEEVESLVRRVDRFERSRQSDMYDWALRTAAELRSA